MHTTITRTGRWFLFVESLWAIAWLGVIIWFNVTPASQPYEQILFDTILRSVASVIGLLMVTARSRRNKGIEWYKPLIFWISTFIMVRAVVQTWRIVPLGGQYWQALAGFAVSGLAVSILELFWIWGATMYLNKEEWNKWAIGFGFPKWNGKVSIPVYVVNSDELPGGINMKKRGLKNEKGYDSY